MNAKHAPSIAKQFCDEACDDYSQVATRIGAVFLGAALLLTSGSGQSAWFEKETPGERFRKAMKTREQLCASRKLVPGDTGCDILKLKPADPMATPEGRYAHSLKLPAPQPTNIFVKGMTSEQYFAALCERQAGEFIVKSIEDVSGVVQMRPRELATDYMLQHLYAMEDPFGSVTEGDTESSKHGLVQPSRYKFVERPAEHRNSRGGLRIVGSNADYRDDSFKQLREETIDTKRARYGFTWRGLEVPNGREYGIVGSELIVIDTATDEVLAVRRGFIRSGDVRNSFTGVWWLGGHICPKPPGRFVYYSYTFLTRVLKPRGEQPGELHVK